MDNKIKDNSNTILKTYDLNFGDYKFSISSVSTFEKLDEIRKNCFIFKFTILYEKVKLDDKGVN